MAMKRILIALTLLALPVAAFAQVTEAEITEHVLVQDVITGAFGEIVEIDAEAALDQIKEGLLGLNPYELGMLDGFSLSDQGNFAIVRQEGLNNLADVSQQGQANVAIIVQEGTNITTKASQIGQGNVFGVRLVGNNLVMQNADGTDTVLQEGFENVYLLDFEGNDQLIPVSTQVGVDNQVVQVGQINTPFGVEQYGNGMRMVIIHNGIE
jgi:minor curlin subunit